MTNEQQVQYLAKEYGFNEVMQAVLLKALDHAFNQGMMHVRVDRQYVSVHGTDGCLNCETGRITTYAHSRWCVECLHEKETRRCKK